MRTVQQKVEIYSFSDALIASGVLIDLSNEYMEIIGDIFPRFGQGEQLKICAYDDMRGICWYIATVRTSEFDRMTLVDYHLLEIIQRRRNTKVKTTFESQIYFVYDSENNKVTLESPIKISIRDISVGGVFFIAEHIFFEESYFEFYFNQGPKHLRIKTKILRRQDLNRDKIGYGCVFEDITEKEQDILFSFIWELQRLQRKRLKFN